MLLLLLTFLPLLFLVTPLQQSSRPWAMAGADDVAGDDFVGVVVVVVVCIVIGNIF